MKKLLKKGLAMVLSVIMLMSSLTAMSGTFAFAASSMTKDDYFTVKPTETNTFKISEYNNDTDFENDFKAKTTIIKPIPEVLDSSGKILYPDTTIEYASSVNGINESTVKISGTHPAYHGVVSFPNPDGDYVVSSAKGRFYITPSHGFWSRQSANYLILGYNPNSSGTQDVYTGIGIAIIYDAEVGTRVMLRSPVGGWYLDKSTGNFTAYNSATSSGGQNKAYNIGTNIIGTLKDSDLTNYMASYEYNANDQWVTYDINWEYSSAKGGYIATVTYHFDIGGKKFDYKYTSGTLKNAAFGYLNSGNIGDPMYVSDTEVTYDVSSYRQVAADKFNNYFDSRADKGSAQYEIDYNNAFAVVKASDEKVASIIESTSLTKEFRSLVDSIGVYDAGDLVKIDKWVTKYNNTSDDIKEAIENTLSGKLTGLLSAYKALKSGATFFDDFESDLNWKPDYKLVDDSYNNWRPTTADDFKYTKVANLPAMFTQTTSSEKVTDGVFYYQKVGEYFNLVANPLQSGMGTYYKSKITFAKCSASDKLSNINIYYTKSGDGFTYVADPKQENIADYYTYSGTRYFTLSGEDYTLDTDPSVTKYDKYYTISGNYNYIYYREYVTDDLKTFGRSVNDPLKFKVLSPNVSELDKYYTYQGLYTDYFDILKETNVYSAAACTSVGDADGNGFWGINEDPVNANNKSLWLRKSFNPKNTEANQGDSMNRSVQSKPSILFTTKDGVLDKDQYIASYSGKMYFSNLYAPWDRYKYGITTVYSYTNETSWKSIGLSGDGAMTNITRSGDKTGGINNLGAGLLDNTVEVGGAAGKPFYRGQWLNFSLSYDFDKGCYVYSLSGFANNAANISDRGGDSVNNIKGDFQTRTFEIKGATSLIKKVGLINTTSATSAFDDISVTCVDAAYVDARIAELPEVDQLTIDHEDLVYSVNQLYGYLSETEQLKVQNRAKLLAAIQKIKEILQARDNNLDLTDYSTLTFEDGDFKTVDNPTNALITSYYEKSDYTKTTDTTIVEGKEYYVYKNGTFQKVNTPNVASLPTYYEKKTGYIKTFDESVVTGKVYYEAQKGVEYINTDKGDNRKGHDVVDNPYKMGLNKSDKVLKITRNTPTNKTYTVYNIKPEALNNNGMLGYFTGKFYLTEANRYDNPPIIVYDYVDDNNWKGVAFYIENGEYGFHRVDKIDGSYLGVSSDDKKIWYKNKFFTSKEYSGMDTTAAWVEFYIEYSLTTIKIHVAIENNKGQRDIFGRFEDYKLIDTCATGVGVATFSASGSYFDDLKVGMFERDEFTAARSFLSKNSYVTQSYPFALYMSQTDEVELNEFKEEYATLKKNLPKALNYLNFVPNTIEVLDASLEWVKSSKNADFAAKRDAEYAKRAKDATDAIATGKVTYYTESAGKYTQVTDPDNTKLLSYYVLTTDYVKTTDVVVNGSKEYYVLNNGEYQKVGSPQTSDISNYYEKKDVYKPAVYSNYKVEDDFLHGFSLWRQDERNTGKIKIVEDDNFAKLTTDKKVVENKQYYTKDANPFSQKTSDTSVVDGKAYYKQTNDGSFEYVENPVNSDISLYYDSPYKKVTDPKDSELSSYYEDVEVVSFTGMTSITPKEKFLPKKAHLQNLSYRVRVTSEPEWWSSLRIYYNWVNANNYSGISFNFIQDSDFVNTHTCSQGGIANRGKEEFDVMNVLTVNVEYSSNGFYTMTIHDQKGHEIFLTGTASLKAIMKINSWGKTAHYSDIVAYYDYGLYDEDIENSEIITYYTGNTYTNPGDVAIVYGDRIGSTVSSVQAIQLNNLTPNKTQYIDKQSFDFEGVNEDEFSYDPTEINDLDYWLDYGVDWNLVSSIKIQQKVKDSIKFIMPKNFTNGVYAVKINGMNIAENPNDFKIVYFNAPYIDYTVGMDGATSAPRQCVKVIGKNIAPNTTYKVENDYSSFIDNGVRVKLAPVKFKKTTDTTVNATKTYYTEEMVYEELDTVNKTLLSSYYELSDGNYKKTTDTKVTPGKVYYTGKKTYVAVSEPVNADVSKYYERVKNVSMLDAKITNIYSDYALEFEVPNEIEVPDDGSAVDYEIYIYNGYGDNTCWGIPYVTQFARDVRSTWSKYTVNIKDYIPEVDYNNAWNASTFAFVNALSELADNGGGILRIPKGVYRITQNLIIPENVQIIGDSKEDTELLFSPYQWDYNAMPKALFQFNDNFSIENVSIQGSRASGIFSGYTKSSDNIYINNIYLWFSPNGGPASDAPHDLHSLGDTTTLLANESKAALFSVSSAGDNINITNVDGMDDNITHRPLVNDLWGSKYFRFENNMFHDGWSEVCANYGWVIGNEFDNACIGIWGHGTYLQDNHLCNLQANNREVYVADRSANYSGKIVQYSDDPDNVTFKFPTASKMNAYLYDESQLYIRSGQGAGQTRKIISIDPVTGWFTVDRPFAIMPNRNSQVILRRARENIYFVKNYYENGGAGGFYGGVADVVYDSNIRDKNIGFYMMGIFNDVNWYYSIINETYVYNPMNANHVGRPSIESGYSWEALSGYNASMCGLMRNNEINGMKFNSTVGNSLSEYALHDIIIDNNRFNDIGTAAISSSSGQETVNYRDGFLEYRNTYNNVAKKYGGMLVSRGIVDGCKKSTNSVGSKRWIYLESEEKEYFDSLPYGDVDGDGKVTLKDAILVRNYLIGRNNLTDNQIKRADVDGDGVVTLIDANEIKYKVVGLITKFVIE